MAAAACEVLVLKPRHGRGHAKAVAASVGASSMLHGRMDQAPHAVACRDSAVKSLPLLLWRPVCLGGSQLGPLWHHLRLATICQLWAAYQRARHHQDRAESAGPVAARILSSCRKAILGDWRLATVSIGRAQRLATRARPEAAGGARGALAGSPASTSTDRLQGGGLR